MRSERKKSILLTGTFKIMSENNRLGLQLDQSYMNAVAANGGIPLVACCTALAEQYADITDGLIITGGESVHPRYFNETFSNLANGDPEEIRYLFNGCNSVRDEMEFALFHAFCERRKPIMGICRGFQLINAATGGINMLDFPRKHPVEHNKGIQHLVVTEENSLLRKLYGTSFLTNSFHRDCAVSVGPEMFIAAKSEDGIIEAIEHTSLPIIGFQFHPEKMRGDTPNPAFGPNMDILFQHFINLC